MERKLGSFKDKKFRYGTFSTLTIIVVVAVLVVVNILAGQLNLNADLTADKLYSLTQDTEDIVKTVEEPVTIYALFPDDPTNDNTGAPVEVYRQLLKEYASINPDVKVEYKDPFTDPVFANSYKDETTGEALPINSLIVQGPDRYKVISGDSLRTQELDYNTYSMYTKSIDLEPQVTNAIRYVLGGETAAIYMVTGHDEPELPASLKSQLDLANFTVQEVNLLTEDIPEDCKLLFMSAPLRSCCRVYASAAQIERQ